MCTYGPQDNMHTIGSCGPDVMWEPQNRGQILGECKADLCRGGLCSLGLVCGRLQLSFSAVCALLVRRFGQREPRRLQVLLHRRELPA